MIEWMIAAAVAVVAGAGLYLATSRDLVSIAVGLALLGSAVNLFVFAAGRLTGAPPPLIPEGATAPLAAVANPVPQALVLTAIVIGFAFACFGIALALALAAFDKRADADALEHAEPPPRPDGDPGELP
ncbi:sodium:proton antiporter [Massilia consociata]|uniref:Sodium:proton antiporter n=1 Tax=Massilia consociata TaxID=760117 RepID=A0ABV6FJB5_9BURK